MMDILERIKKTCLLQYDCNTCTFATADHDCLIVGFDPRKWNIKAIRKALEEPADESKTEIIVPEKWTGKTIHEMNVNGELTRGIIGKQNGVIDCLKQIKERLDERT